METTRDLIYWRTARGEFLKLDERLLLRRLARNIAGRFNNPTIINIGVSWGASVHCLYAGAPNTNIVGIDIDYLTRPVRGAEYLPINVNFIIADSARLKYDEPVHLVFVDGDHSYNGVKGDIDNWSPRVVAGGLMVFHDYNPQPKDAERLAGVKQAIDEWYNQAQGWREVDTTRSIITFRRVE